MPPAFPGASASYSSTAEVKVTTGESGLSQGQQGQAPVWMEGPRGRRGRVAEAAATGGGESSEGRQEKTEEEEVEELLVKTEVELSSPLADAVLTFGNPLMTTATIDGASHENTGQYRRQQQQQGNASYQVAEEAELLALQHRQQQQHVYVYQEGGSEGSGPTPPLPPHQRPACSFSQQNQTHQQYQMLSQPGYERDTPPSTEAGMHFNHNQATTQHNSTPPPPQHHHQGFHQTQAGTFGAGGGRLVHHPHYHHHHQGSLAPFLPFPPRAHTEVDQAKLEKKRERNRLAATKCRQRKMDRIKSLEDEVRELQREKDNLLRSSEALNQEVLSLRAQLEAHARQGCPLASALGVGMGTSSDTVSAEAVMVAPPNNGGGGGEGGGAGDNHIVAGPAVIVYQNGDQDGGGGHSAAAPHHQYQQQ